MPAFEHISLDDVVAQDEEGSPVGVLKASCSASLWAARCSSSLMYTRRGCLLSVVVEDPVVFSGGEKLVRVRSKSFSAATPRLVAARLLPSPRWDLESGAGEKKLRKAFSRSSSPAFALTGHGDAPT